MYLYSGNYPEEIVNETMKESQREVSVMCGKGPEAHSHQAK